MQYFHAYAYSLISSFYIILMFSHLSSRNNLWLSIYNFLSQLLITNCSNRSSETGSWEVPKTPWVERICHLYENMNIEDEKHFLLECPVYTHIRSQFHNISCNTDLPILLTFQNYSELGTLLTKLFEHRNTILNFQTK